MTEKIEIKDHSREGLSLQKILQLFKLFHPKNTKTLARLNKFTELDIQKINELKNLNIKGLILDVDDCIARNHEEILPENIEYIKKLKSQGIEMVFYSNMKRTNRYDQLDDYVEVLTNIPAKPNIKGFKEACERLDLKPKNILMVGDNYITDSGSIKLGIPFIKIKPIKAHYTTLYMKLKMGSYGILRSFYDYVAQFHDLFREKPLNSKAFKNN